MFEWLDLTQIFMLLATCYACFVWGKFNGVSSIIGTLLEKNIIKESDLERL